MLSYVEKDSDIDELIKLDPDAEVFAKIESVKGMEWVKTSYEKYSLFTADNIHLMAARGDLFIELGINRPEKVLKALYKIAKADKGAILASRILTSLVEQPRPTCSDITDIACMIQMGYKQFMIGDDICFNEDGLMLTIEILSAIGEEYT